MSILESIADLFRPKIVVASRHAMKNENYDLLCFFAEIGHPNGNKNVRWLARRNGVCFLAQTSSLNAPAEMNQLKKCPEDIEVRYRDPNIWQGKYSSQARDGVQYLIGIVVDGKCRWREFWNPETDCKPVELVKAIFDEMESER